LKIKNLKTCSFIFLSGKQLELLNKMLLLNKEQYSSAQPQGISSPGSGTDHTPGCILSYAKERISRTLMLFSLSIVN
jgi:hypothetical protein